MTTYKTILFCLLLLFLINCSEDENATSECNILPDFENAGERLESRTLKGHVLFSWQEGFDWNYAIVPNLNISPAQEGVCEDNTMMGKDCLLENLSLFAEGEEIFWQAFGIITTLEGESFYLEPPPQSVVKDIISFSDSLNLDLLISYDK